MVCQVGLVLRSGIFPQTQAPEHGSSKSLELGKDLVEKDSLQVSKGKVAGDRPGAQGVAHSDLGMAPSQNSMAELKKHQESVAFPKLGGENFLGEDILLGKILRNEQNLESVPLFERLRLRITWWEAHAPLEVLHLITKGVVPNWDKEPVLPWREQGTNPQQVEEATNILQEYLAVGAVKPVEMDGTQYLVPWFVIARKDGDKVKRRLISDCRDINRFLTPKKFRLEN